MRVMKRMIVTETKARDGIVNNGDDRVWDAHVMSGCEGDGMDDSDGGRVTEINWVIVREIDTGEGTE